jgi:hypothetical protein
LEFAGVLGGNPTERNPFVEKFVWPWICADSTLALSDLARHADAAADPDGGQYESINEIALACTHGAAGGHIGKFSSNDDV